MPPHPQTRKVVRCAHHTVRAGGMGMKLRTITRMRPRMSRKAYKAKVARERRKLRADVHAAMLDKAKRKTGSDGKTAQLLHTTPQRISDVRKARRHLTPESAARLAYFLGDSPVHAVLRALADSSMKRQSRDFWLDFSCGIWPGRDVIYRRWASNNVVKQYPKRGGCNRDYDKR